jgi:5-methyltetrahydropteroyltriglutamate--homocysteine methyltransferase
MKTSQDRILTTHTGSLPRGDALSDILVAKANGEAFDAAAFDTALEAALNEIIGKQIDAGVDIGNDGEMPRTDFISYIADRMSGFGRGEGPKRGLPLDAKSFPIWFEHIQRSGRRRISPYGLPQAVGPLAYDDISGVERECADFKRVLGARSTGFSEGFMTAVSPGFAATAMVNLHYDTFEDYVFAMARALKSEYEHIASQGFILQIDSPDMGIERAGFFQDNSLPEFIAAMEMHVAALNEALENIPRDQIRFHACWGNRDGPHYHDVPCPDMLPVMYQVKAGALVLPFANSRHSHEIEAFRTQPLPDHMSLVVGAVETTNNYVEHPMVVAERLVRAAKAVGDKTRIMAGTDCGFGTFAGDTFTAEDVVWAKLESLVEGARLASAELWS